jgi:hypothetical protein
MPPEPGKRKFTSRQIKLEPGEPSFQDADDTGASLLFITHSGGARLKRQDQARIHSHVRNRNYVRQRKERAAYEIRRQRELKLQPAPDADVLLGLGAFDPFNALPVKISSSSRGLLDYCTYFSFARSLLLLLMSHSFSIHCSSALPSWPIAKIQTYQLDDSGSSSND